MEKTTLHLIIIEESRNDAEALANTLRNAGQVVRYQFVQTPEEFEAALDQQVPDLVLCSDGVEALDLPTVSDELSHCSRKIPIIYAGSEANEATVVEALRLGATDMVSYDMPDHLRLVVEREMHNVGLRRKVHQYETGYQESERRCRALLDSSRDCIAYIHDGMHIYANRSYLETFGFDDMEEIKGTPIMDMVDSGDHAGFKEFIRTYGRNDAGDNKLEVNCISATGSFKALMEFAPASIDGEPCTQLVIRDQSNADPELQEKLKYLSKQDLVTGLFNRQYFMEELELAVSAANTGSGNSFMLYIQLDNFKTIKETVGLAASDLVIKDVADLLQDKMVSGIASRFGDNSFAVLVKDGDINAAQALAEALRHAIEEHIVDIEGRSITVTASIGISLITDTASSAEDTLSQADLACEVARSAGGNRVHLHNPVTDEQLSRERDEQWRRQIEAALENDRFHLVYQPIVSLAGNEQELYEVLVRMRNEEGEDIPPGQFIPVALQTGLMGQIDRWVIGHALTKLAEHRRNEHDTRFFIKLSSQSLEDEELPLWINEQLKNERLQSDAIVLEIAEKNASEYLKQSKALVKALAALKCKTSLEHFGGMANSFQLLKHLPVDYLKIDGSFIHNLMANEDNQAMVKSIVELTQSLNKQCIAEFVEDASSLTMLFQFGVDFIQGYFLQAPHDELDYDFSEESA